MTPSFLDNGQSQLVLNPRLPETDRQVLEAWFSTLEGWTDHLWIQSSGSSSAANEISKLIGLSKKAFRASAAASNRFLEVTPRDVWGLCLPDFHVGGLSIWARAEQSGSSVIDLRPFLGRSFSESVQSFWSELSRQRVSLLSLVPTQIFDLVQAGLRAPEALRAVIVGGAALEVSLYQRARELGWPLLPSFGMTEACSQIATAPLWTLHEHPTSFPDLVLLDHLQATTDADGRLLLRGESLMSAVCQFPEGRAHLVRTDEVFQAPDFVELAQNSRGQRILRPRGRQSEYVKILGEGVNLAAVRARFAAQFPAWQEQVFLLDLPHPRQGSEIVAVAPFLKNLNTEMLGRDLREWNSSVFPPERVRRLLGVLSIPRTDLGKVAWTKLREDLKTPSTETRID